MGWEPPEPPEPPEKPQKRKPKKLTRKAKLAPRRAKRHKVDLDGLAPQQEWQQIREACFERSGYRCEKCGKPASQAYRFEAHHRKLVSRGGRDELCNLAALCSTCHRWCHDNNTRAEMAGWIVPSWADPARRAVTLHDGRMVLFDDLGGFAWEGWPE